MEKPLILLVDDDEYLLEEVKIALSDNGYTIITATTGEGALKLVETYHPVVALVDKKLPDVDGQELIKRLKQKSQKTAYIIFTGYASADSAMKGYSEGITDYIEKTVSFDEIQQKIDTIINSSVKEQKKRSSLHQRALLQARKYEILFENANDAILVVEARGSTIVDGNKAAVNLTGYKKEELFEKSIETIVFGEGKKRQNRILNELKQDENLLLEGTVTHKNGKEIPVAFSFSVFKEGNEDYYQYMIRDISKRKKVEKELKEHRKHLENIVWKRTRELEEKTSELEKMNEQLKEYDTLKSKFVSNVAHELLNPLTVIKTCVENVHDGLIGKADLKAKKALDIAKRAVNRISRFTRDVLDLSKIESGKLPLNRQRITLTVFLTEMVEYFETILRDKKIELITDFTHSPLYLWADEDLLKEVFINLVNNAISYTPPGKKVFVNVFHENHSFRLEVKDQGPGISKKDQDRIFDEFYRIFTNQREGTGLGLSIAKEIIELHKGTIRVESEKGKGATFIVQLPLGRKADIIKADSRKENRTNE